MKAKDVAWASYEIVYRPENCTSQEALAKLQELLSREEILVSKHTKKGPKEFDIRPYFQDFSLTLAEDGSLQGEHRLPISLNGGVNPGLLKDAAARHLGLDLYERITRTNLYNEKLEPFC